LQGALARAAAAAQSDGSASSASAADSGPSACDIVSVFSEGTHRRLRMEDRGSAPGAADGAGAGLEGGEAAVPEIEAAGDLVSSFEPDMHEERLDGSERYDGGGGGSDAEAATATADAH